MPRWPPALAIGALVACYGSDRSSATLWHRRGRLVDVLRGIALVLMPAACSASVVVVAAVPCEHVDLPCAARRLCRRARIRGARRRADVRQLRRVGELRAPRRDDVPRLVVPRLLRDGRRGSSWSRASSRGSTPTRSGEGRPRRSSRTTSTSSACSRSPSRCRASTPPRTSASPTCSSSRSSSAPPPLRAPRPLDLADAGRGARRHDRPDGLAGPRAACRRCRRSRSASCSRTPTCSGASYDGSPGSVTARM